MKTIFFSIVVSIVAAPAFAQTYNYSEPSAGALSTGQLQVQSSNALPRADVETSELGAIVGKLMILDGTLSHDDGAMKKFLWRQISGPTVKIINGELARASVVVPSAGVYVFELVVTDNAGLASVRKRTTVTAKSETSAHGDPDFDQKAGVYQYNESNVEFLKKPLDGDPDRPLLQGNIPNPTEKAGLNPQPEPPSRSSGIPPASAGIEHEDIGAVSEDNGPAHNKAKLIERLRLPGSDARSGYIKLGDIKGESQAPPTGNAGDGFVEISVSGVTVRGWDPKTKQEVAEASPRDTKDVATPEDIALLVAKTVEEDTAIESVSLNYQKIEFEYKSQGRFLWFFPVNIRKNISVTLPAQDGEEARVTVKLPWYRIFMRVDVPAGELESALGDALNKADLVGLNPQPEPPSEDSGNLESRALQNKLQALARIFQTLSNASKAKHDAAMAAVQNTR